jgi:hypothetical protein
LKRFAPEKQHHTLFRFHPCHTLSLSRRLKRFPR